MPVKLTGVLQEFGIAAETTESRGWKAFTNGQLVEAAAEAGFTAVITRDRLFAEAAAKALRQFPQLAVVLVRIPQLQGPLAAGHLSRRTFLEATTWHSEEEFQGQLILPLRVDYVRYGRRGRIAN